MRSKILLLTATILAAPFALPHAALSQPVTGIYSSIKGGVDFQEPVDLGRSNGNGPSRGEIQSKVGGGAILGIGYGFGNGFRVEIGPNIFYNKIKNLSTQNNNFTNGNGITGSGDGGFLKYGPMVSAYYDFDFGLPIYPYIGAGVGYERVTLSPAVETTNRGIDTRVGGKEGSFAYMAAAGFSFPLPVPGLAGSVEYRFMGQTGNQNYNIASGVPGGPGFIGHIKFKQEYDNIVTVGLRYQWNNPEPPAPEPAPVAAVAAPAPAAAKTYLVFFDWDKAALTPRAIDVIAQAASDSHTNQTTTIDVSGYTDTSGTAVYNQGLSVRRAEAVATQLEADGVPTSEITTQGFGDTHLLVATGPGVREPQNRRVEIVLQ
jgi:OOP family OmpA-OmpF porin